MAANLELLETVHDFWFDELTSEDWFRESGKTDNLIAERFGALHQQLEETGADEFAKSARTALAAVIVLDQFSRNIHRRTSRAFASDGKALAIARLAIERGLDTGMTASERVFLYMPFMHSEDLEDQERSVELFTKLGEENNLKYAIEHRDIVARFGRFPHRNKVLGRQSTGEELAFLDGHSGYGQ